MKRRIPSLNWLRVFEAAARHESFARAAETLNMSAAAVSQQVRALEQHLGQPLFVRGPHDVRLTDAGRAFRPTVAEAINNVELRAATLFGAPGKTPLTIRATLIFATSWLAERLPEFQARHSDITVHLISDAASASDPGDDVELVIEFGVHESAFTEREALFGERLYPVAAPDICRSVRRPPDLLNYRLIEIADHRAGWFRLFDAQGIDGRNADIQITDRTDLSLAMAASGSGIALARAPATDAMVARYGLEPCISGVDVPGLERYYLLSRTGDALSGAAGRFRKWLLAEAGQQRHATDK